jgi:hypothetical protein
MEFDFDEHEKSFSFQEFFGPNLLEIIPRIDLKRTLLKVT